MVISFFDQFNIIVVLGVSNFSIMLGFIIMMFLVFFEGMGRGLIYCKRVTGFRWLLASVRGMVIDSFGGSGERYYPFIVSLFVFLLIINIWGLCPYIFTPTAHVGLTVGFSFTIIVTVTIRGALKFGWGFLSMFMPMGAPMGLSFGLVIIESVSYLIRIISLGVRLAANITAGHLLLAIISGFVWEMVMNEWLFLGLGCSLILIMIVVLEVGMALIQAYYGGRCLGFV